MKTLIPMIPIVATLALFEGTTLRGEETVAGPKLPPLQERMERVAASTQQAVAEADRQMEEAQRQFESMDGQLASALDQYQNFVQAFDPVVAESSVSADPQESRPNWALKLPSGARRSSPSKALVVRSADTDAAAQANLEEDLAVMLRVFDKAIEGERGGKAARSVMGINVFFSPGSAPSRSLYLDGYGALFLLKVDFPLLAPPAAKDEQKEKPASDSSWEAARRELYGSTSDNSVFVRESDQYDADKVTKLKNALLEALKSATNVRNLKPDDSITVCVFGGAGQRVVEQKSNDFGKGEKNVTSLVSIENAPGRGSILTMRAKKADVDAFAKGKSNTEEFRRKTVQTIYQSGGTGMW
jgi:hypothetical protein